MWTKRTSKRRSFCSYTTVPSLTILALLAIPGLLLAAGAQEAPVETEQSASSQSAEQESDARISIDMVVPTGVPAVSAANLDVSPDAIADGYVVELEVVTSPDVMGSRLLAGEADIAIVPTNLSARLYNREVDIQFAGGVVWGILYVVADEPLSGWEDLRGREVGMLGRGLTPDIVFRHLAQANGLDPERDVVLRYVNATTELAPNFLTGEVAVSIMPEPMLTRVLQRADSAHVILDLQREWARSTETERGFPQASLVYSGQLVQEHPEFVEAFLEAFDESVGVARSDPSGTARRAAELMPQLAAETIEAAMPRANLELVNAAAARAAVEDYFTVLLESDAQALGGGLPGDDFYYTR
ncbi:MAG: ABC transporter substrate-binding protein [Spirochaetes bacterium]|nr:ABC transporter substrate-binding protein [Spirochaetota bacterium]